MSLTANQYKGVVIQRAGQHGKRLPRIFLAGIICIVAVLSAKETGQKPETLKTA